MRVSTRKDIAAAVASPVHWCAGTAMLRMHDIHKRFGGVHALRGASLEVARGEIVGLCGENGAGKSTLLKILAGVHPADAGEIVVDGVVRKPTNPADARRAGIAVVYQELTLVPELSVAQNLLLGREPRRFGLVDHAQVDAIARRDLARFGFADRIDVTRPVGELGIGLQQIVEIVRALPQDARILVLDEPTAALNGREAEALLGWLRTLRDAGAAIVYVSHRLDEIFALCDRVTVLRDGRTAATMKTTDTTPDAVVAAMVGGEMTKRAPAEMRLAAGSPVLEVQDLHVYKPRASSPVIAGVSLTVHPGEIVAVCGAMGSGRTALLSALFGCARGGTSGRVRVGGAHVTLDSPRDAIARGIAYLPEDRKGRGLVPMMTVEQNLSLTNPPRHLGLVDDIAERRLAEQRIRELRIRGDASAPVVTLSGGNQQKVVLGKWLERKPRLLLLDEPTRGVDVGAREEIYAILEELAKNGVAILLASSDLVEVLRLARRIFVLRDGRFVTELDRAAASEEAIVQLTSRG
jgi:ABC-type sugar transport system ATPase subunit